MIDVETLGHNVTSARGPFAGPPSRLFRHVAMAILEHGPGWVRLRGPFGPQPLLRRPPCTYQNPSIPRTRTTAPTTVPRPVDHTSPFPQTADAPIMGFHHGLRCIQTPPQREYLGRVPARAWARQCTVLCCACCIYPDHWVGPSTTHTPFQAPATDHLHQVPLPHQQKTPSRIRAAGRILSLVHDRGLPQLTQFRRPRTTGRSRPWSATSPSGAKGRGEYHQVSAAAYGTLPLH